MENENFIIKWKALEYEYFHKSPDWFWALWIISIGIIVTSVIYNSMLFAILIFISAFTLSIQAVKKPRLISYEIDSEGIIIYGKKYLFENLESFKIIEDEFPRIILKSKKHFMPFITVPLGDTDTKNVNEFLNQYLKEENHEEPWSYKVTKHF
ncbi:hypothetical protein KKG48_03170 [Patescibacteria group bacterium]|nr:hypothetical protein [Patescibacteria group bacterium]MCG2695281.1 hypothetical protein [Candidatus Parcubacteria bacterium]